MLKSIARDASREFAKKTAALSARWFANKYWTILKKKCTVSEDWSFKYGRNLTLSNNCQNKENYKCQP